MPLRLGQLVQFLPLQHPTSYEGRYSFTGRAIQIFLTTAPLSCRVIVAANFQYRCPTHPAKPAASKASRNQAESLRVVMVLRSTYSAAGATFGGTADAPLADGAW